MKPHGDNAKILLLDCIADIKQWLAQNFLHLNEAKTEYIVFGDTVTDGFGTLSAKLSPTVKNLGVIFDSYMKFDKQISNVVKTSFSNYVSWPK